MVANGENRSEDAVDDIGNVQRPPDIEQDMKEMERRKRVKMIIESQIFKEELERIIESQLNEGYFPSTLSALQQVTELISPKPGGLNAPAQTMPINDIRGVDALKYDVPEKVLRCKLASVYRLIDYYGWSQLIYNHISVRINQEDEHFLINPFGLQYPEITASSLIKVDMQGNMIDPGSTNFSFNRAGFVLHSAIHAARPDIKAIIHIHHPACVAVSCVKHGLLCISQEAAIIGDVSYHDYKGLVIDPNSRSSVANDLGPVNKVLILKNHGVITCGETLEEALYYLQNLVKACETQVRLEPIDPETLHEMSAESKAQVRSIVVNFGAAVQGKPGSEKDPKSNNPQLKKWKIWDLEFEAQMRMLDNAGYRTGYIYRQPLLRVSHQRSNRNGADEVDVAIPPASQNHFSESSFVENWLTPLKNLVISQQKKEKSNWITTPNAYQKVQIDDPAGDDEKKVTKWVTQNGSNGHLTNNPVKIDSSHQFIPLNENGKKEFREKQKKMKEYRLQNQLSEGPQSKILDAAGDVLSEGDQRIIIGAASRGIIQKEYQQDAKIYKAAYEKNPFDKMNSSELDEYNQQFGYGHRQDTDSSDAPLNSTLNDSMQTDDPTSPDGLYQSSKRVQRSHSARLAAQAAEDTYFTRKFRSERKPKLKSMSEQDAADESAHDLSASEASQSEKSKKKKKGIRAPSFLKKKKKDRKEEAV